MKTTYHELTEEQKFALCVAAGVPIDFACSPNGKVTMQTAQKCGIAETEPGRFIVFAQTPRDGQQ